MGPVEARELRGRLAATFKGKLAGETGRKESRPRHEATLVLGCELGGPAAATGAGALAVGGNSRRCQLAPPSHYDDDDDCESRRRLLLLPLLASLYRPQARQLAQTTATKLGWPRQKKNRDDNPVARPHDCRPAR